MSKHTPGPWHNSELGHQHNVRLVYAADGILVADAGRISHRSNEELTANARLIAAAPDLLKTLVLVREWMKDCMLDKTEKGSPSNVTYKSVLSAIAKASGE